MELTLCSVCSIAPPPPPSLLLLNFLEGEVIEGYDIIKLAESYGTAPGTPKVPVKISKSGTV